MKQIEIQNKKTEVVKDIICDICGNSCKVEEYIVDNPVRLDHGDKIYIFEYMDIETHWGYHSNTKDTQKWTAQVCEKCVDEKLSFIKFEKTNYI
jgi:diaminopimelate decarboxylase